MVLTHVVLKGCDRAYCEETKADGSHKLAGCHCCGHVGSCVLGWSRQCFVLLQGAVAVAIAVGVCRWVLVLVFTCNAPQSIELELYRGDVLAFVLLEVGVAPE